MACCGAGDEVVDTDVVAVVEWDKTCKAKKRCRPNSVNKRKAAEEPEAAVAGVLAAMRESSWPT